MSFKMAVIGYGGMAHHHHRLLKELIPEIKVKGAYDVREESRQKMIENGIKVYASPEEIYADKEVDLVLVATPNDTHMSYSIDSLKSGKNVVCEKPVTLDSAELEKILKVTRETKKFFTVHHNRRWDSDFLTIRKILEDKTLNNAYSIESRVQGSRQVLHGWRGYKQNGGGMVYDWGIHLIDQMLNWIPEKLISVDAHLHRIFAEVDDEFTAVFRFESGLTYIVNISMNSFIKQPRWHMSCKDGTAVIENWDGEGKIAKLADVSDLDWGEVIVYTSAGPTRSMAPRPKETTVEIPLPVQIGSKDAFYKNIVAALEGKEEPIVKPHQLLRVMNVIDLVFESEAKGVGIKCSL